MGCGSCMRGGRFVKEPVPGKVSPCLELKTMLSICGHLGKGWEGREGSLSVWATGKRRGGPDVTGDKTEGQGGESGQDGSEQLSYEEFGVIGANPLQELTLFLEYAASQNAIEQQKT